MAAMLQPPQRQSLVAQTAEILRKYVATRPAGEKLASERELGHQLGVSRMTLRAALAKLERERLLRAGQGRSRVIVKRGPRTRKPTGLRDVVLLSPIPLHEIEPRVLLSMNELHDMLAQEQHQLKFVVPHNCYRERPQRDLKELAARLRPSAWVLLLSTRAMQEWFQDQGLPAVVAGSRHEGVRLPAVDVDFRAVCRHAVGRLVAKGHRHLVLLNPKKSAAGDLKSEAGFIEAGAAARSEIETTVAQHDGTVEGICTSLDRLLARPQPPTGFLVSRSNYALTALGHLIQRGVRFPEKAAFISRSHDPFLEYVVPSMARYAIDASVFAHKLTRVVLEFTAGGNPPPTEHLLMPRFISGRTLG